MTDKELNHAIAEKLGWKPIPPIPGREHLFDGYILKPDAQSEHDIEKVPDFTGSLDAMRIAEEWLKEQDIFNVYCWNLQDYFKDEEGCSAMESQCEAINASSKRKAIEFAHITRILPVAGKEECPNT